MSKNSMIDMEGCQGGFDGNYGEADREEDYAFAENQGIYGDFAEVYDRFMDNTPYDEWAQRLDGFIKKYGISKPQRDAEDALTSEKNLVLDLGCGTGILTEKLYDMGYDMMGIDCSEEMLGIAMRRKAENGKSILYLLQDMRELELYSTVGTVISVCDCVNYILDEEELQQVFSLVNNYLFPGGLFIFDFNTDYKYREIIGDTTIAENREECSFIWENYYDPEDGINQYDVTVFVQEDADMFRRFTETHFQKGYSPEQMRALVEAAGMQVLEMLDADTGEAVTAESQRVYVIAREQGKQR